MIEKLLAALADGAEDGGPRPGIGAEEIADILWLAARVDPAGARPPGAPAAGPPGEQPPTDGPPPPGAGPVPGSEPGGPAGGEPDVQLFPASPRHDPAGRPAHASPGRRGSPLRLPRTASLDDPLALMRCLRPVGRRSIGGPGEELDEQLTVERSIERMVPTPVLRPAESRWLDLALVVDTHHSMLLWSDLVDELRRVLTRSGVFRDVRTWQLTGTGPGATPMVTRGRGGPPRNPLELADPAGRRLILVLTDTVAGGWREAPVQGVLRQWCAHNAVAVLNVLPERLWTRGAVRPAPFAVRADRPAAATRSWQRVPAVRRARTRAGRERASAAVVPVVGVAAGSLARLVRVVSGDGRWRRLACLRLDAEPGAASAPEDPAPGVGRSALEAVEHFRASASPTAQQLAAHLAAVPLTLPVMTLVRRSLLPDAEHGHLAEVALGGLFAPWGAEQDPEEVEFEFLPGVREALLGSQLRGDVAAVRELVRRRVWEFMSRNRGTGPDFSAIRVTRGRGGRRPVAEEALPFAARPHPQDPPDPGLRDRVVRVRYHGLPEPQEVGTLLTPRLVLTVGDMVPGAIGWVRAGDREVYCRPVWWDDALPRVFLLLADEDLVDPVVWSEPLAWAAVDPGSHRVRVDGRTDQGAPVALTGEVVPYEGDRNGELIRLSTEPESWTHYRGGPVSLHGELIGVVHGVWPDRMVFLSGRALLEQAGFRDAMAASHPATPETERAGASWSVCLAVRPGDDGAYPRGSSPEAEVSDLLIGLMGDEHITGRLTGGGRGAPVLVTFDAPGALGEAGRLLSELPRAMAVFGERRMDGMHPSLAVSVGSGEVVAEGNGVAGQAVADAVGLVRHPALLHTGRIPPRPGSLRVALSHPLYLELDELLGPTALGALEQVGGGTDGWLCTGDPAELGRALAAAGELRGEAVDWPTCGVGASHTDPAGCIGIRIPGRDRCLAHLEREARDVYIGTLGPGSPVDLRGTPFRRGLLQQVLRAVREPETGRVRLGRAAFHHAHFADDWDTVGTEFAGRASFGRAVFTGRALFEGATFSGPASFEGAVFQNVAAFDRSHFHDPAVFRRTVFGATVGFTDATFDGEVSFERAVFEETSDMNRLHVEGPADFTGTRFLDVVGLHGAVFAGPVSFAHAVWERGLLSDGAVFHRPVDFDGASFQGRVRFTGARFEAHTYVELPSSAEPDRRVVDQRPDGSWDISLADP